jgi:minor extracellular serine protease Vpr
MMSRTRLRRAMAAAATVAMVGAFAPAASADDPYAPVEIPDAGELDLAVDLEDLRADLSSDSGRYVLELADDPIAADIAVDGGQVGTLSVPAKEQRRAELRAQQRPVRAAAEARGATVEEDYQVAINGLRVAADPETAAELAALDEVVGVYPVELAVPTHADTLPLLDVPEVWERAEATGEGISVAIIDSGIDYTHAMFGGPGTREAFETARDTDTPPAEWYGPGNRVVGGWDFVGDDYNAGGTGDATIPQPNPNPLDCGGHGTHVAGSAGGGGVTADGEAYTGPYDTSTLDDVDFEVAPGVAPEVDLYALRVFGCAGSTAVTVDAIEWAVDNEVDVINMSLGSLFGRSDQASSIASDNAAEAGILVVTSAGNSGAVPYIHGSPGASTRAISVAANDAIGGFDGALIDTGDAEVEAIIANSEPLGDELELDVHVLGGDPANPSLGCDEAEYIAEAEEFEDALLVTQRGVCARVDRAIFGARHGAAAVVMINDSTALPPLEGEITDPVTNSVVRIPFLGVRSTDGPAVATADTVELSSILLPNPGFSGFASFTSAGPRGGDAALKPDVTAPGVSVLSAAVGTGTGGQRSSGTSMSAPHVAGVAAMAKQVHEGWEHDDLRAAVVSTADSEAIAGELPFTVRRGGAGMVQPVGVVDTTTVAHGDEGTSTLSLGVVEVSDTTTETAEVTLRNLGDEDVTYAVDAGATGGSQPHGASTDVSTVTVPAGGTATVAVDVTIEAPDVATGSLGLDFVDVSGLVEFTPTDGTDVALAVPYLAVPRARADVDLTRTDRFTNAGPRTVGVDVTNPSATAATAHTFAWGLASDDSGLGEVDLEGVGVRSTTGTLGGEPTEVVEFALSTYRPWSTAATIEFQVPVDSTGDGQPDRVVLGIDLGLLSTGTFNGQIVAAVWDLATGAASAYYFAVAPTDNHTVVLPVPAFALGLEGSTTSFRYQAAAFDLITGESDQITRWAPFDLARPAVAAPVVAVAPNSTVRVPVQTDLRPLRGQQQLGVMMVVPQAPVGEQATFFESPTRGRN